MISEIHVSDKAKKNFLLWKIEYNLKGLSPKILKILVDLVELLPKDDTNV